MRLSVGISQLISQYFESHLKLGLTFGQLLPSAGTKQTSALAAVIPVTESVDKGQDTLLPSHLRQLPPELLLMQTVGQEGGELGATEGRVVSNALLSEDVPDCEGFVAAEPEESSGSGNHNLYK